MIDFLRTASSTIFVVAVAVLNAAYFTNKDVKEDLNDLTGSETTSSIVVLILGSAGAIKVASSFSKPGAEYYDIEEDV